MGFQSSKYHNFFRRWESDFNIIVTIATNNDHLVKCSRDLVDGCQVCLPQMLLKCRYKFFNFSRDHVIKRSWDLASWVFQPKTTILPNLDAIGITEVQI